MSKIHQCISLESLDVAYALSFSENDWCRRKDFNLNKCVVYFFWKKIASVCQFIKIGCLLQMYQTLCSVCMYVLHDWILHIFLFLWTLLKPNKVPKNNVYIFQVYFESVTKIVSCGPVLQEMSLCVWWDKLIIQRFCDLFYVFLRHFRWNQFHLVPFI